MTPHVLYVGPFALRTGYAQAAHDYMLALHRAGVSLEIQPTEPCNTDDLEERYHELFALTRGHPSHEWAKKPTHVIIHAVPAALPMIAADYSGIKIAITTWETSHMSEELANKIDVSFNRIIVPSSFCAQTMSPIDVAVIPHCFDPAHWPIQHQACGDSFCVECFFRTEQRFTFYSILGWNDRKNPIGLLKAYFAEFSSSDNVVLRLKAPANINDINALKQSLGYDDIPAIEIISEHLTHGEMVKFHHAGDCFVTAARGEGWNLPAFEAAILGKPVIAPAFGGHLDFMRWGNHMPVGYTRTPAIVPPQISDQVTELGGLRLRAVIQTAPAGITARQYWAEPDLGDLQRKMRHAYELGRVSGSNRHTFEQRFSYATVGAQLADIINQEKP